jgi:Mg/Co/Ni transporter MgtE
MHCWWIFDFETDYYIYIIDDDRTIIGFVGFVANLLNRPTDGVTASEKVKSLDI